MKTARIGIDTDDAYSAARIRAARARMIRREEYDKLLRMSDAEVLGYLQGGAYRVDVEALGVKDLDDLEAIDRVIARHEDRALDWLGRISSPGYARLVLELRRANDVWNLRIAAEAIAGGVDTAQALDRFARPGTFPTASVAAAKNAADLAAAAARRFPKLRAASEGLNGFLDALERAWAAEPVPEGDAGALLADERNLLRALRCVREAVPVAVAISAMSRGGTISRGALGRILAAKDLSEALRMLQATRYRDAARRAMAAGEDLALRAENEIHRSVLHALARISSADPLGPEAIARYVADLGIESSNLRLLVKAKRLGLDEAFVRDRLVAP